MSYLSGADGAFLPPDLRRALRAMLDELHGARLEVILAPSRRPNAREHDMIRAVLVENADWYQRLCAAYSSGRKNARGKFDTRIKRRETVLALQRMLKTHRASGFYEEAILDQVPKFIAERKAKAAYLRKLSKRKKPGPGIAAQHDRPESDDDYVPF